MRPFVAVMAMVVLAAGCSPVRYVDFDEAHVPYPMVADRTVGFDLDDDYYLEPPTCVAVFPPEPMADEPTDSGRLELSDETVVAAFSRHLAERVPRVAAGADGADCGYHLSLRPWKVEKAFAVVWAHQQIGLEAELRRVRDGKVVWRARHADRRGDGGMPLSPVSILTSSFDAAGMMADESDVTLSLLDDVCRRIVLTIPDARGPPTRKGPGKSVGS